jgi:hypothetical protein
MEDTKKINSSMLDAIIDKIKKGDESTFGKYIFNNFKLIVSRKTPLSNVERSRKFYAKRRENGLCIICGEKIKRINPRTKKLYRYCDKHRDEEKKAKKSLRISKQKAKKR